MIHDWKRLRGIEHGVHLVAEVCGNARGGLDALLHLNSSHDETADAELVEALLKVRARERIPCVLDEERFVTAAVHEVHEPKLGIAFPESRIRIGVQKEEPRQAGVSPVIEQNQDVLLKVTIASSLPPLAEFERVLNVDQKQSCVVHECSIALRRRRSRTRTGQIRPTL